MSSGGAGAASGGGAPASGGGAADDPMQPITTLVWVSHAFIPSSTGSSLSPNSNKYLTVSVFDRTNYTGFDPVIGMNRIYKNPTKMIDVLSLATGYPGAAIRSDDIGDIIRLFGQPDIARYTVEEMVSAFPPLTVPLTGVRISQLFDVYNGHDVLYRSEYETSESITAVTLSSYDIASTPRILNYQLQCVKSEEPEDLRLVSGLYVITSLGGGTSIEQLNYMQLADEVKDKPQFDINIEVFEELNSIHIPARTLTIDQLLPVFSSLCAKRGIKKYNLAIVGCGGLYFPSGPSGKGQNEELAKKTRKELTSTASMSIDKPGPYVIPYKTGELLSKLLTTAQRRIADADASTKGGGGAGHAGGGRKTIKRRGKHRRSTKRTKKFANRRHIVRNRRSAPRRRTQI
jgi:hypothetical protein